MSGIYIPGMEMPTDCIFCPLFQGEWQMCSLTERGTQIKGRAKDCPLIPVPVHGRLIDADKLTLTDIDIALCEDYKSLLSLYINKVESAQTVIEAEVSE